MRFVFLCFALVLAGSRPAMADDFATDFLPQLSFEETYRDTVFFDRELDDYEIVPKSTLAIHAKASLQGVDLDAIDEDTTFSIEIENLSLSFTLGEGFSEDGARFFNGDRAAIFPLLDEEDEPAGEVALAWDEAQLTVSVTARNAPDSYGVKAQDLSFEGEPVPDYADTGMASLSFGEREFSGRTVYLRGSIDYRADPQDRVEDPLAVVDVAGAIDSKAPANVALTEPAPGAKVNQFPYTLRGTARDDRALESVQVQIGVGEPQGAVLDGAGHWSLAGVVFARGANVVRIVARDADGNETAVEASAFSVPVQPLTVRVAGTGAGQVSSELFRTLRFDPIKRPGEIVESVTTQDEDAVLIVAAAPAPGSLFAGWTSTLDLPDLHTPRLVFTMRPGLVLTAHFVPDPLVAFAGRYSGLVAQGGDAPLHGIFSVLLGAGRTFTGTIRLGKLELPVRGQFGQERTFAGVFVRRGIAYTVALQLDVSDSGEAELTGTISSASGFAATLAGSPAGFGGKGGPAFPGRGVFNALLPAAEENADANFPAGIGFGRVKLSKRGEVKFVGKLGDGTLVSLGAALSKELTWPFFAPLYRGRGSIAGQVTHGAPEAGTDLSGTLDWFRPSAPRAKSFAAGFAGQSRILGTAYTASKRGAAAHELPRVLLNGSGGAGVLHLDAPAILGIAGTGLERTAGVQVGTAHDPNAVAILPPNADRIEVRVKARTGLFIGSFRDPLLHRTIPFAGAVLQDGGDASDAKLKAVGGLFRRDDRTGAVQIEPPLAQ